MVDNYIRLDPEIPKLGDAFREAGYNTGYIGKWHLDGDDDPGKYVPPERRGGFEWWRGFENSHDHLKGVPVPKEDGTEEWIEGYQPEIQTDVAIEFLEEQADADEPFCLVMSWGPPHTPFEAPEEYAAMYDAADLDLRENVPDEMAGEVRENLVAYYGMITSLDDQVGRLMAALEENGAADDTVFAVSSDHGEMMGSHGNYGKDIPLEESIHIPLLARYPEGIEAGRVSEAVVSLVDYMPTFLGLCDADIPETVQGRDCSEHVLDSSVEGPDATFLEGCLLRDNPWRAIRTAQYLLVVDRVLEGQCLFDTDADPYQRESVLEDPAYEDVRADLHERLLGYVEEYQDTLALPHERMGFGTDRWMTGEYDESNLGVEK
jgi:arylsulfatase A-like enzyme